MAKKKVTFEEKVDQARSESVSTKELIQALVSAIETTRPTVKKTPNTRTAKTPWTNKDGSPKSKLKRKAHQHGIILDPDMLTNEQIDLFNKLRPGVFLEGHVKVVRRKDRGIDIDYPVKTAAQRLRLVNQFGIRDLNELLQRCIAESENPKDYILPDEQD